jgi:predicted nucleic acid-binding protein
MSFMSGYNEPLFLIDSNVLVYAYDNTDKEKHEKAKVLLEKCWKKEIKYAISIQNLAEFFIIITKKVQNPLTIDEAEKIIKDVLEFSYWHIISYDQNTFLKAISLHKKFKKHFWDTMIIATMLNNEISHIYTENIKDFEQYAEIKVVNPLE